MKLSDFYGSYSNIFDKMDVNVQNRFESDYIRKSDGSLKYPPEVICRFLLEEFCTDERFRVIFDDYTPEMKFAIIDGYRNNPDQFIDKLLADLSPQLYNDEGQIFDQAYDDEKIDEMHGPDGYTDRKELKQLANQIIGLLVDAGSDNTYVSDEGDCIHYNDRNRIGVIDAVGPEIIELIDSSGWKSEDFVIRDSVIYFPAGELVDNGNTGSIEIVNDDNIYSVGDKFLNTTNGKTLEINEYLGNGTYGMGTVGEPKNIKTYDRVEESVITAYIKRGIYEEVVDNTDDDPNAMSLRDGSEFLNGGIDADENGEIVLQTENYSMHIWADKKNANNKKERHWAVELRDGENVSQYSGEIVALYNRAISDFELEELVIDGENIDEIFGNYSAVYEQIQEALGIS